MNNKQRVRSLWLHIGLPKTGTSFLQATLKENRQALLKAGFLYPQAGEIGGGHALLAWPLLSESRRKRRDVSLYADRIDSGAWSRLGDEVACCQETVILSSEYFFEVADPSEVRRRCSDISECTKIVIYLRRQDELAESGYNQSVKAGLVGEPFKVDRRGRLYDWYDLLKRWEQAFQKENLCVRIYDKETISRGIVADFAGILGIDASHFTLSSSGTNPRLHPELVEFQRIANHLGFTDSSLAARLSNRMDERMVYLTREEREIILSQYEESNRRVAREYFDRSDGNLFDDLSEMPPVAGRNVPSRVIVALLQEMWMEIDRMKANLETE